jgi:hypothetical protein
MSNLYDKFSFILEMPNALLFTYNTVFVFVVLAYLSSTLRRAFYRWLIRKYPSSTDQNVETSESITQEVETRLSLQMADAINDYTNDRRKGMLEVKEILFSIDNTEIDKILRLSEAIHQRRTAFITKEVDKSFFRNWLPKFVNEPIVEPALARSINQSSKEYMQNFVFDMDRMITRYNRAA